MISSTAPPSAPGEDSHLALALANTRFNSTGEVVDAIATARLANRWLTEHDRRIRLSYAETVALQQLRDSIRALFRSNDNAEPAPKRAVDALNDTLRKVPSIHRLHRSRANSPTLERVPIAGTPAERMLADIATDAAELLASDDLAACGAPGCVRFLLRTHGKRQWCSTRCGNRVRAARHYANSKA